MKSLTKIALVAFALGVISLPSYAETVTETKTTVTTFRTEAPFYMGQVQNVGLLQELTLADFQKFGTKPSGAFEQYQQYKKEINQPSPNPTLVIYKMKVSDRDLTLADFQGVNVSTELAQARYQEYLRMNPASVEGDNAHYVYVYHRPLTQV